MEREREREREESVPQLTLLAAGGSGPDTGRARRKSRGAMEDLDACVAAAPHAAEREREEGGGFSSWPFRFVLTPSLHSTGCLCRLCVCVRVCCVCVCDWLHMYIESEREREKGKKVSVLIPLSSSSLSLFLFLPLRNIRASPLSLNIPPIPPPSPLQEYRDAAQLQHHHRDAGQRPLRQSQVWRLSSLVSRLSSLPPTLPLPFALFASRYTSLSSEIEASAESREDCPSLFLFRPPSPLLPLSLSLSSSVPRSSLLPPVSSATALPAMSALTVVCCP